MLVTIWSSHGDHSTITMTLRVLNFITFLLFLFQEFNDKIATKHKIMKFISRVIQIV